MRKRLISIITIFILTLMLCSACAQSGSSDNNTSSPDNTVINIASMKGPTSIGLVKLYSDSDNKLTTLKYNQQIYGTAAEISTGLIKGDIDIAAVPANQAAILYHKTNGEIKTLGINTLSVLYILQKNDSVTSVSDLKGKTIYSTGQGTTPEYTLRYLLSQNGIDPDKDVTINYCSEASEVVSAISTMDSAIAMLPQPYVTVAMSKVEGLSVALDISEEWKKTSAESDVITGVVVVRTAFADEHPELISEFLKEYKLSTDFANNNVEECAALVEHYDIFKAAIATKAIPECNIVLITGEEMTKPLLSYLNVLYEANPASVGGTKPDEAMLLIP